MIERWKNDDGSETVLITYDPPRRSWPLRILTFLGMTLLVVVVSALPLLLIVFGVRGLTTGQIEMWSRIRGGHKLYGNEAIVVAWLHLALGIGFFGFMFRDAGKTLFKWPPWFRWLLWLLWIATSICVVAAIYRMFRGS